MRKIRLNLDKQGQGMAISWFTVLKLVPWGDVIENAPKVAQGARNLWNTVGKKSDAQAATGDGLESMRAQAGPPASLPELQAKVDSLTTQLTDLQLQSVELHDQMQACAKLLASLAEQNTQLISRLEINRRRVLGLTVVVLGLVLLAVLTRL